MKRTQRLDLRHAGGTTPIAIGPGAFAEEAGAIAEESEAGRLFVVSSRPVLDRLGGMALDELAAHGIEPLVLTVPDGEAAKSLEVVGDLWRRLIASGGKRDSRVLALGGGSVSDVAGFAAGAFLRGIPWLAVPTTLLAQVDAAIGGKTAVDLPEAKNSVGLFHHPGRVVCDTSFLGSLPARELRSGLFEVVKVAALFEPDLLDRVTDRLPGLVAGDADALAGVVAPAVRIKVAIVERDPADRGERKALNFGHTLGHALEAASGYRGLTHGEAVGYGMLFALRLATRRALRAADAERIAAAIRELQPAALPAVDRQTVLEAMARDKKAREAGLEWVLPSAVGGGAEGERVPLDEIERELGPFLDDPLAAYRG